MIKVYTLFLIDLILRLT